MVWCWSGSTETDSFIHTTAFSTGALVLRGNSLIMGLVKTVLSPSDNMVMHDSVSLTSEFLCISQELYGIQHSTFYKQFTKVFCKDLKRYAIGPWYILRSYISSIFQHYNNTLFTNEHMIKVFFFSCLNNLALNVAYHTGNWTSSRSTLQFI